MSHKGRDDEHNHALRNAEAHIAGWVDAYAGYNQLVSGESDEVSLDGETFTDAAAFADQVQGTALDIQIRGPWHSPGVDDSAPAEFQILVTTGGPAFRIIGELDQYNNPRNVRAEHQDWGTPWTEVDLDNEQQEAVDWFASLFCYGE